MVALRQGCRELVFGKIYCSDPTFMIKLIKRFPYKICVRRVWGVFRKRYALLSG